MELNKKALDILLKYKMLEPDKTAKVDFLYAKEAGYMFERVEQTHDEAVEYAFQEFEKCDKKHITDLFLSSLSTSRLDWRSGLPAYSIMRVFPRHSLESNGSNCLICPSFNKELVDFSFINLVRFSVGGLINGRIYHLAFVLKQHNTLLNTKPTIEDFVIFKKIIEVIKNTERNDGPSKIQKSLKNIVGFKSNEEQRKAFLETLGYCSILETDKHKGFLHQYINLGLAPRFRHSSDWLYPIDWWKGKDAVNKEALEFWFGEYKELQSLFT
jgi:hypothetical protein